MNFFQYLVNVFFGHRQAIPHQTESGNDNKPTITMVELIKKIADTNASFTTDLEKYAKLGNKAAGARARKASLELERLYKEFRKRSVHETPVKD